MAEGERISSPATRGRGTAAGGGGGTPQARSPRSSASLLTQTAGSEAAVAPSTVLRTVPLPRFTGEDLAVHATAVAIDRSALLIFGPSGAGKSRLAATLIAASTRRQPIQLVGDDRILLTTRGGSLVARPHPRIAGFLERRGLGIVAYPFVADAAVCGIVRLGTSDAPGLTTLPSAVWENFVGLPSVLIGEALRVEAQRDAVLAWWRDAATTHTAKATPQRAETVKV